MAAPRTKKEAQSLNGKLAALSRFLSKETLTIYLAAGAEAISSVLIAERGGTQMPVYFVSKVLQHGEVNYKPIEKLIFALVHTARQLRRYFQAHPMLVLTDSPIKQVLNKSKVSGRLAKWAIELSEHEINYAPRTVVKGAGLILICPKGEEHTYALHFEFPASNNEAEYEALLSGLRMAEKMGIKALKVSVNSQLISNQMNETFEARDLAMQKYLKLA
ncbi:uncharacterized protein [Rutidosis leptorrhynchoides]|uniref:uncharacterized protein n=1 Tax=Rutidosis leptorrhynchoides TaxID=125765 RepID=UPI003A99D9CA